MNQCAENPYGREVIQHLSSPVDAVSHHSRGTILRAYAGKTVHDGSPDSAGGVSFFRSRWYPNLCDREWNDWHWQIANRLTSVDHIKTHFMVSREEEQALLLSPSRHPVSITPYYASLLDPCDPRHPLRRTVIPVPDEYRLSPGESTDPLNEEMQSPVPGIVHRYPDRVLFLITRFCASFCRYCTRSRMVEKHPGGAAMTDSVMERAFDYIERNPRIRDVLLSGGDPLTLEDDCLELILARLRHIPHVEIIRIGTKVPMVLPQRITPALCALLKRVHPLWMSIHVTHPLEITPEVTLACEQLADAGIPLGSQTVLLSGVNDTPETLRLLYQKLMTIRVRPYYLYQCDPILGSHHFRTPVARGREIMEKLQGNTSGYALPRFVIDAPGGGGKIPVDADNIVSHNDGSYLLKNYQGKVFAYPDSDPNSFLP